MSFNCSTIIFHKFGFFTAKREKSLLDISASTFTGYLLGCAHLLAL